MRYLSCFNEDCLNAYAPFFDFEPDEVLIPCPVCGQSMTVTTLEDAAAQLAAKNARLEAAAVAAAEAEAAANPPPPPVPPVPTVEEKLAGALEALPDGPVSKKDLAAVIATLRGNDDHA